MWSCVCAVFTLYTTTAAYYIVHIRQLGPCNVTLKFQLLGSLVYYLIVGLWIRYLVLQNETARKSIV